MSSSKVYKIVISMVLCTAVILTGCTHSPDSPAPTEAPSFTGSPLDTDDPAPESTAMPADTPEPQVEISYGVPVENADDYVFVPDPASGKACAYAMHPSGDNRIEYGDTYEFTDVRTPRDGSESDPFGMILQMRDPTAAYYEAYPVSRPADAEYLKQLIESSEFKSEAPESFYGEICMLTFGDGAGRAEYVFYLDHTLEKRTADGSSSYAVIDDEALLHAAVIASEYFRLPGDRTLLLNYSGDVSGYDNYSLTLKYGEAEVTLDPSEACAMFDDVFGSPVTGRYYANPELEYELDECIELIERYGGSHVSEHICYAAPDGRIIGKRDSVPFEVPGVGRIIVGADFTAISFDSYSFDALLKYAGKE